MDFKRFDALIIVLLLSILVGCGQVGYITGGDVDNTAPQPVQEEITPPFASKNTKPDKIIIPFDEFISLNNAAQNIRVVPEDVRLEAKIKKKSLVLTKVSGDWKENTTYAIYLKRAVKDITEGNDSLISYVFSTGAVIDSLMAGVRVVDAFTNKPLKDVTVGLYTQPLMDDTAKVLPRYVALTDNQGVASFSYLQLGPFYAYAFTDDNKNNYLDSHEKRGVQDSLIYADTAVQYTPTIRLMPPISSDFKVNSNEAIPPASWTLSFSQPIETESLSPFSPPPVGQVWNEERDSVTIFYGKVSPSGRFKAVVAYNSTYDTLVKKYYFKQENKYDYKSNLQNGKLAVTDTFSLRLNEAIKEINLRFIKIQGVKEGDSMRTSLTFVHEQPRPDEIQLIHDRSYDSIFVTLLPGAVNGYNFNQEDSLVFDFPLQKVENVGNIAVSFDTIPAYGILELVNAKKEVERAVVLDEQKTTEFKLIQPGKYTFRFISDKNRDGKWTTGDIFEGTPPEEIIWFEQPTTVRANWDISVDLQISTKKELQEGK